MKININRIHFGSAVIIDGVTCMSADINKNCKSIIYDTDMNIYSIKGHQNSENVPMTFVHPTNVQMFYSKDLENGQPQEQTNKIQLDKLPKK